MKVLVSRVLDMVREKRDTEEPLFLFVQKPSNVYIFIAARKNQHFFSNLGSKHLGSGCGSPLKVLSNSAAQGNFDIVDRSASLILLRYIKDNLFCIMSYFYNMTSLIPFVNIILIFTTGRTSSVADNRIQNFMKTQLLILECLFSFISVNDKKFYCF